MIYPIGIQDFGKLRKGGYVYVDKTALIYKLATTGSYYFLSRPRRFGKSLLLSTIEAYFSGKKELFAGLAIEKLETKWAKHPILHLDLNTESYTDMDSLERRLNKTLLEWEKLYGKGEGETSFALRFEGIVQRACDKTGKSVVILVDEYDKPMLQTIGNEELQKEYRNMLKAFYSVLKTQDRYIQFAFLTGVTKFGKVSVFSDINNLDDISMDNRFIDICGITEQEMHNYFEESIHVLAAANSIGYDEACKRLKEQYDGYHFRQNCIGIYNPFSLLNTLNKLEFANYWFETGTPSFLVHLLKKSNYDLENLTKESLTSDLLNSIDSMSYNPVPIIYQSGYLTIKDYNSRFGNYLLGFPNKEVEDGFYRYLLPFYTPVREEQGNLFIGNFVEDVEEGLPKEFMKRMETMFSDSDYRIAGKMELYFQNAMYLIFKMMGFYTDVERATSRGRIDIVIKARNYIYVMELKLDGSADDALNQIEEMGYAAPFANDSRPLFRIGVNFSSKTRCIAEWKVV